LEGEEGGLLAEVHSSASATEFLLMGKDGLVVGTAMFDLVVKDARQLMRVAVMGEGSVRALGQKFFDVSGLAVVDKLGTAAWITNPARPHIGPSAARNNVRSSCSTKIGSRRSPRHIT
jgi:hypothetical protein